MVTPPRGSTLMAGRLAATELAIVAVALFAAWLLVHFQFRAQTGHRRLEDRRDVTPAH
jgi:hypothetical protein